jgi:hypothetical protein
MPAHAPMLPINNRRHQRQVGSQVGPAPDGHSLPSSDAKVRTNAAARGARSESRRSTDCRVRSLGPGHTALRIGLPGSCESCLTIVVTKTTAANATRAQLRTPSTCGRGASGVRHRWLLIRRSMWSRSRDHGAAHLANTGANHASGRSWIDLDCVGSERQVSSQIWIAVDMASLTRN